MKTSSSTSMQLLFTFELLTIFPPAPAIVDIIFRPMPLSANGDEVFNWKPIDVDTGVDGTDEIGVWPMTESIDWPASTEAKNSLLLK